LLAAKLGAAEPIGTFLAATAAKLQPVSITLVENFVSDDQLQRVSDDDIVAYKQQHAALFQDFVTTMLQITAAVRELPMEAGFEAALEELKRTDLRKRQREVAADIQDAWTAFFKTTVKGVAATFLSLGVTPGMPLSAIALTAASASATWALPDLVELLARRRKIRRHGMYYLMNFA